MMHLTLTPERYETILVALKIADNFQKMNDVIFTSESFKEVYDELSLDETAGENENDTTTS